MAQNNNKQEEEKTAIENLNEHLTDAGKKLSENRNILWWTLGGIAAVAAIILAYVFLYHNPHQKSAYEAFNQVEISAAGNDSVAAAQYKKVASDNSGTTAGKLAALSAAESYYEQGKYKEAAECLEKFSSSEPVLNTNAIVLTGDCYVNLKNYDKALGCYSKAISKAKNNDQIVPRVLLKMANVYDVQKKYQDAMGCYEQIKKDYPQFQLGNGMSIDAYIEREKARLGK